MRTAARIADWLNRAAAEIEAHHGELTALDAAIGDADHGANMRRGFQAVVARLEKLEGDSEDGGAVAKAAAMALISTVGGAAGPLYGTFLLRLGAALSGKREVADSDLAAAFRAGLEGVQQRGKAQPGEKTMVDALAPACDALERSLAAGQTLAVALGLAADAAREGMLATTPLVATKGRASYLGERSRGHQDPGATSAYLLVKAAAEAFSPAE